MDELLKKPRQKKQRNTDQVQSKKTNLNLDDLWSLIEWAGWNCSKCRASTCSCHLPVAMAPTAGLHPTWWPSGGAGQGDDLTFKTDTFFDSVCHFGDIYISLFLGKTFFWLLLDISWDTFFLMTFCYCHVFFLNAVGTHLKLCAHQGVWIRKTPASLHLKMPSPHLTYSSFSSTSTVDHPFEFQVPSAIIKNPCHHPTSWQGWIWSSNCSNIFGKCLMEAATTNAWQNRHPHNQVLLFW